jgi:hypothetical protein
VEAEGPLKVEAHSSNGNCFFSLKNRNPGSNALDATTWIGGSFPRPEATAPVVESGTSLEM